MPTEDDRPATGEAANQLQTAALLRGLLALVDAGEITASSALGTQMVRRIEGAIVALEATTESSSVDSSHAE